jgi:hypothetical protein
MGFYLLATDTHKRMGSVRSNFYWRGASGDFKYHMMRWESVCRPKEFGDLGIVNTKIFNECLMVKWIWKLYTQKDNLWARLVSAKYMKEGDFFRAKDRGSQFWRSIHKVKHLFKWGAIHIVGDGKLTKFWDDVWISTPPYEFVIQMYMTYVITGTSLWRSVQRTIGK